MLNIMLRTKQTTKISKNIEKIVIIIIADENASSVVLVKLGEKKIMARTQRIVSPKVTKIAGGKLKVYFKFIKNLFILLFPEFSIKFWE